MELQNLMKHVSGTPLLVHPDLLGSTAGVGALDKVVHKSTGCEDERMLGEDERSGTCTREHDGGVLGCTCGGIGLMSGSGIRLVAGSCGITIEKGTSDRSARGKASGKRLID